LIFHPKRGIVVKCDLCGGSPKCVEWCPNNVIIYINSTRDVLNSNLRRKLN
jgi:Fe-S-cluster-containing hydrogenase component 2